MRTYARQRRQALTSPSSHLVLLLLALLALSGCVAPIDDGEPLGDEEAVEAELDLVEGTLAEPPAETDDLAAERPATEKQESPLELDLQTEPVPEPWQGKGEEK